ncbi:MAG: hypothetical protein V1709_01150, partial [Planctomycetota bacterium]
MLKIKSAILILLVALMLITSCNINIDNDSGSSGPTIPQTPPSVTTDSATDITVNSATLNGTVNPNGFNTSTTFQWGISTGYGNYTSYQSIGKGNSSIVISATISGLLSETTYYFQLRAININGTSYGSGLSFTTQTPATAPVQVTSPNPASGTPNASINTQLSWAPASGASSYDVYFGTTSPGTSIGNQTGRTYNPGTLAYSTTYYWRIDSRNSIGPTIGIIWSFTTQAPPISPTCTTDAANNNFPYQYSPILNGTVNPNGSATNVYFEYGITTTPITYPLSTTSRSIGSGTTNIAVTASGLSGLVLVRAYNFRIVGINAAGTTYGNNMTFDTYGTLPVRPPPTCTTNPATNIIDVNPYSESSATLNGTVNPNGSATNAYFEWGQTIPPIELGGLPSLYQFTTTEQIIGSGTGDVAVTAVITSLTPLDYNFRVVGTNS